MMESFAMAITVAITKMNVMEILRMAFFILIVIIKEAPPANRRCFRQSQVQYYYMVYVVVALLSASCFFTHEGRYLAIRVSYIRRGEYYIIHTM